jgi:hypothetical protein
MRRSLLVAGFLAGAFLLLGTDAVLAGSEALTADRATGTLGEAYTVFGTVTLTGLTTGESYSLRGLFEALPTAGCPPPAAAACARSYPGSYSASFSRCSGGSITGGIETVAADGRVRVSALDSGQTPPLRAVVTSPAGVSCHYRLTLAGKAPPGTITSARNHMWVLADGAVVSDLVGPAMQPPVDAPPPVVPEAPIALLLPVSGLLTATLVSLIAVRRRRNEA